ncbi:lysophospholipid acyltransferase family protein [Catenuloplanes indicus]|uniref:1-acyl-sn-glycerol-3-phosphate acyltransferase n=1 Tax=Catenuloplanes indicus TaxID=137267 RepID=A0AAE4AZQ7_9ACTN|nr:lysophospholipid acyltransferase family protein [Catenuloplanes indicus]MDQ0368702.1 1-acyl-sn-glycerol-3-phosphate acyltransferase [Catenuloplanes indicus]
MDTVDPSGVLPGPAVVPPWRPSLPAPLAQPRSNCDSGCLPVRGFHRRVSVPRQAVRAVTLAGALIGGLALLPLLPFLTGTGRQAAGRWWARAVLAAAGVRLVIRGAGFVPRRRALLVANHNSWLDTVALLAVSPARMTAKHDIRHWPVIGVLATLAGTIFIDRRHPRTLPTTVARITDALRKDDLVAVFPAGTTGCGRSTGPGHRADNSLTGRWRPAVFQAAVDAHAAVVPIRLGYREGRTGPDSTIATFLSAESLFACAIRVIAIRDLTAVVTIEPALHPDLDANRRVLARAAEGVVRPYRRPTSVPAPAPAPASAPVPAPMPDPASALAPSSLPASSAASAPAPVHGRLDLAA